MLSIYIDQSKLCITKVQEIQNKRIEEEDAINLKRQFDTTFDMGWNIIKELANINKIAYPNDDDQPAQQPISDEIFIGYKQMSLQ